MAEVSAAGDARVRRLAAQFADARDAFSATLATAEPDLLTAPGLLDAWSARELVAHLAHWDNWGSTCLEAAAGGRMESLASGEWDVDAQNAQVAQEVASEAMPAVLDREARAYERFAALLAALDPALLDQPAPWGGTVETIVLENGPEHYAEHTEHLRAWFGGADEVDEDDA